MLTFKWDSFYETHIGSIDDQHRKLVDMLNELGDKLQESEELDPNVLQNIFNGLAEYAQTHFKDEEAYMGVYNVDERHQKPHKQAHINFFTEATKIYQAVSKNATGAEVLFHFLSSWLAIHILGTDKILAKQIELIEKGSTAQNAFNEVQRSVGESTAPLLTALNQLFTRTMDINHKLIDLTNSLDSQVKARTQELKQANENLKAMMLTDNLTKLGNRAAAMAFLENEWNKPFDPNKTVTCIMVNVDNFKQINYNFGHESGNRVLITLADTIRESVHNDDFVCRLGGDEFVVLFKDTDLRHTIGLSKHLKEKIDNIEMELQDTCHSTSKGWIIGQIKRIVKKDNLTNSIRIGVAQRDDKMNGYMDLLKKADDDLRSSK